MNLDAVITDSGRTEDGRHSKHTIRVFCESKNWIVVKSSTEILELQRKLCQAGVYIHPILKRKSIFEFDATRRIRFQNYLRGALGCIPWIRDITVKVVLETFFDIVNNMAVVEMDSQEQCENNFDECSSITSASSASPEVLNAPIPQRDMNVHQFCNFVRQRGYSDLAALLESNNIDGQRVYNRTREELLAMELTPRGLTIDETTMIFWVLSAPYHMPGKL